MNAIIRVPLPNNGVPGIETNGKTKTSVQALPYAVTSSEFLWGRPPFFPFRRLEAALRAVRICPKVAAAFLLLIFNQVSTGIFTGNF